MAATTYYTCEKCTREFATQGGLLRHLDSVHSAREKQPYRAGADNETKD